LDEAWLFIKNETIRNYVVQAQKTWRKHNAAMNLITYDLRDGMYIIPKVMDSGYVELGKKRMDFSRKG
jgi:type IV secretory pathway VirB4 component